MSVNHFDSTGVIVAQEIFDKIKSVSGRIDKEKILKDNQDNKLFFDMLVFLYNPFIVTGIGKKKYQKFSDYSNPEKQQFSNIFQLMDYLKENNTGKEENVKAVANYVNMFEGRTKEFLQEFFTSDLKIGVTDKTVNKVYGVDTIPSHDVMLAENLHEYVDYIDGKDHVTMLKYDGVRCTAIKENGKTTFLSRNGNPYTELTTLEKIFAWLPDNTVYEGEIIVINYKDLSSKECYKQTSKRIRTDGVKNNLGFMMFDMLPVDEFRAGESKLGYIERLKNMSTLNMEVSKKLEENRMTQLLFDVANVLNISSDISETMELAKEYIDNGQEGLVVRKSDAKYVTKRSKDLLRIKGIETADLRIVDVEEGTKESTKGKLGAIVVEYKGHRVNVGSGFTKEEREMLWEQREELIGQICEVMYTEESSNEQGGLSLRFPRFKGLRPDKVEVDF